MPYHLMVNLIFRSIFTASFAWTITVHYMIDLSAHFAINIQFRHRSNPWSFTITLCSLYHASSGTYHCNPGNRHVAAVVPLSNAGTPYFLHLHGAISMPRTWYRYQSMWNLTGSWTVWWWCGFVSCMPSKRGNRYFVDGVCCGNTPKKYYILRGRDLRLSQSTRAAKMQSIELIPGHEEFI